MWCSSCWSVIIRETVARLSQCMHIVSLFAPSLISRHAGTSRTHKITHFLTPIEFKRQGKIRFDNDICPMFSSRLSMDMYTSATPPNISFLTGSFLTSAHKRSQAAAHSSLPADPFQSSTEPLISTASSLDKDEVPTSYLPGEKVSATNSQLSRFSSCQSVPTMQQCSYAQSLLNGKLATSLCTSFTPIFLIYCTMWNANWEKILWMRLDCIWLKKCFWSCFKCSLSQYLTIWNPFIKMQQSMYYVE